ncbi:MAG: hypothetical protein WAK98_18165 [Gemmobacter sp.]
MLIPFSFLAVFLAQSSASDGIDGTNLKDLDEKMLRGFASVCIMRESPPQSHCDSG